MGLARHSGSSTVTTENGKPRKRDKFKRLFKHKKAGDNADDQTIAEDEGEGEGQSIIGQHSQPIMLESAHQK